MHLADALSRPGKQCDLSTPGAQQLSAAAAELNSKPRKSSVGTAPLRASLRCSRQPHDHLCCDDPQNPPPPRQARRLHRGPIRRERLGGVPRVAAQPAFQLQDLGPQLVDHPGLLDQREKVLT
jgi:hypothetical protein